MKIIFEVEKLVKTTFDSQVEPFTEFNHDFNYHEHVITRLNLNKPLDDST